MKSLICLLFVVFATINLIKAQVGEQFPDLAGETINNKNVTIPEDTKGKYSIVAVAYSQDAERDLRSWYTPTYTLFIDKSGMNAMIYDVNIKLVLMFTGVNKVAKDKAMENMAKIADEALFPYVVFYKGELKPYKKKLNLEDKNRPYIFVLNQDGKIIHVTSGRYTEKKMDKIEELVEVE